MNHLAHFALADDDHLVGSFLGDHIKGRLTGQLPGHIERGIRLHRAVDAFTDSHAIVKRSINRFDAPYRRYAGIVTDLAFDYILARQWHDYYEEALDDYSARTLMKLLEDEHHLPERALASARRMHERNALAHYGTESFLEHSFIFLGQRLSRANPLDSVLPVCLELMPSLERDFAAFYPELVQFSENWRRQG